jgi:hypothetical protein
MKAFLITPDHAMQICVVQEVDVKVNADDGVDVAHICELLGADYFDVVGSGQGALAGHCGYVDGDGLLKPQSGYILCPELYSLPLAGPLLLLGEKFNPEEGWVSSAATLAAEDVGALFVRAYVSRRFAKAAHDLSERQIKQANPDVIVMRVSSEM